MVRWTILATKLSTSRWRHLLILVPLGTLVGLFMGWLFKDILYGVGIGLAFGVVFGLMFAFLYTAVIAVEPAAFSGGILEHNEEAVAQSMIYYSFVTMTTLGYGDITPKIQVAATLAYVQALIGQLYVAILIARLVSLYNRSDKE